MIGQIKFFLIEILLTKNTTTTKNDNMEKTIRPDINVFF